MHLIDKDEERTLRVAEIKIRKCHVLLIAEDVNVLVLITIASITE